MKNISILGSTGSIGQNSLEVISKFPDNFRVAYLSANKGINQLAEQIEKHNPDGVVVMDNESAELLRQKFSSTLKIFIGEEGLKEIASHLDVDIVINSLVGFAGLTPTIEAIKAGKRVALANKETLVVAGEIITQLLTDHQTELIPIDSEHSAILQCLVGEDVKNISKLILTASGGPFLHLEKKEFPNITVAQALNHPNWKMGSKITIDSATLMNKGLEVIEAHYLFKLPQNKIEVLIHPQSIIHSMVEFVDGSVKAQLGVPDMKIPIQYALTYPERMLSNSSRVNFSELREMTFSQPDFEKFECLSLAYQALEAGGTASVVLNAANEVAVELFLNSKITFDKIPKLIDMALEKFEAKQNPTIEEIIHIDNSTRNFIKSSYRK
ncbi:MAG: 1-deoxy-D-xylulose-5-phosphate reductoisomerase [Bacteroidota bacterium]|nr:1-deoxy-D-xylulose-5-phosphate reductoisomerase [Bacteroidota bacterium]